jgi:hypothetical protein
VTKVHNAKGHQEQEADKNDDCSSKVISIFADELQAKANDEENDSYPE